ncbi:MAG: hypothetical protein ACHP8A_19610, partial [Terriglobales bacterium]
DADSFDQMRFDSVGQRRWCKSFNVITLRFSSSPNDIESGRSSSARDALNAPECSRGNLLRYQNLLAIPRRSADLLLANPRLIKTRSAPPVPTRAANRHAIRSGWACLLLFCDNGSEFTGQVMDLWAYRNEMKIDFSESLSTTF